MEFTDKQNSSGMITKDNDLILEVTKQGVNKGNTFNRLIQFRMQKPEDIEVFFGLFEVAVPGYLASLYGLNADLTRVDVAYASLLYFKLPNSLIAEIFAVSQDGVRKANQRLRQKLGVSNQKALLEFLSSLDKI